jgi:hypothetical protein
MFENGCYLRRQKRFKCAKKDGMRGSGGSRGGGSGGGDGEGQSSDPNCTDDYDKSTGGSQSPMSQKSGTGDDDDESHDDHKIDTSVLLNGLNGAVGGGVGYESRNFLERKMLGLILHIHSRPSIQMFSSFKLIFNFCQKATTTSQSSRSCPTTSSSSTTTTTTTTISSTISSTTTISTTYAI